MTDEYNPFDTSAREATADYDEAVKRLKREQEINDFRTLMGTREGRRFVHRLLNVAGVFRTSFSTDSLLMAFNEGNRNGGLLLMHEIHETCPKRYSQMQKEHEDDERRIKRNPGRAG